MSVRIWNGRSRGGLALSSFVRGVPMAVITYGTDVAPHLQRGLIYRRLRLQRLQVLHAHDREGDQACDPFGEDAYDPYGWAKTDHRFKLLIDVVVILFFAAGTEIISLFNSKRI